MTKWLRKWRRGSRYVRSNTKNLKSLLSLVQTNGTYHFSTRYFNGIMIAVVFKCIFEETMPKLSVNFGNHSKGSVAQWVKHQTMNTWMTSRRGFEPPWCQISATLLVPLSKALYSNCSVVRRSSKAVGPVFMYLNINTSVDDKNVTGYSKTAGDHPSPVDCTPSKLHSSTLGPEEKVQLVCTQCRNI